MNGRATLVFWLRFCRRFAVGVVLLYVLIALTLGGSSAARPVWYLSTAAWLVAVGAIRRVEAGRLEVLATNVALTLVLAEGALQLHAATVGGSLTGANLDGYRLVPGHDYGDGLVGNRRGYPGAELSPTKSPGIIRVAALGDSFAVGPAVAFTDNYLTLLPQLAPGIEVGNYGVSGAGPREYRQILESDVWLAQPDVVLVSIFIGNDITEALPHYRHLNPRQHALFRFCERGWRLLRETRRKADEASPPSRVGQAPLSAKTFREVEARRLAVCLKASSAAMEKKWAAALTDLEAIVRQCRQRGAVVAVVLIPDEFQVNDAVLAEALTEAAIVREQLDLDGPQRRLAAFFGQRGVPCLDLLPAFRAGSNLYAPRDTHWNAAGNRLAAQEIAAWLGRESLLKAAPN